MATEAVAGQQLSSFVTRIERVEEEKRAASTELKEIYEEAKGNGFDTSVVRDVVRLRRMDGDKRRSHRALLELYLAALGMGDQGELISGDEETRADVAAADAAARKKKDRKPKSEGGGDFVQLHPGPDGGAT